MSAPDSPALAGMSIGAVLDLLRPDFPDVTISKIRFLEAEGLVTPQRAASGTVLAGHWHPAVTLRGPARDTLRVPCFCHVDRTLILPAFGAFTGSSPHEPPRGSVCFPVGGGRVLPGFQID